MCVCKLTALREERSRDEDLVLLTDVREGRAFSRAEGEVRGDVAPGTVRVAAKATGRSAVGASAAPFLGEKVWHILCPASHSTRTAHELPIYGPSPYKARPSAQQTLHAVSLHSVHSYTDLYTLRWRCIIEWVLRPQVLRWFLWAAEHGRNARFVGKADMDTLLVEVKPTLHPQPPAMPTAMLSVPAHAGEAS